MLNEKTTKPKFAVIGAGHGGLAMAGHLSLMDFEVSLYNRSAERLWGVKSMGGITLEGEIEGFGKIDIASTNIKDVIEDAEIIMVVVPATAHEFIAEQCAPYLKDGQIVILNPGRTFGALEFKQVVKRLGNDADVIFAEAQTFIYASRVVGPAQAHVFRIKNSIPVASVRAYLIPKVLNRLREAYPQFVAGDNIFKTSFENIGAVFHPAICILNSGWIEDDAEFQFYLEGVTESVGRVLEKVDLERIKVAESLGIRAMSAKEWLYLAYGAQGNSLREAMRANPGYRGIMAPNRLTIRYISEDVPSSLVPIASIGKKFGIPTPTINSLIEIASVINETDYWSVGRTVEKLQINEMSLRELRLLAIGEKM
ncbi:MAG: NADP transhydrogenase subunit alpha [Stygiobacter sp. RIFOXYC12_FULL_38_8]|nr:MAG: NADP transhydrogenase subunit alpha [Stygiobacter sp. GWC2_38_9]OGV09743.1 MAG: NADP transhydrogenase subunit alpha [Stygiobacter sp. RIFOXYB2_FULL_37_11]OGV13611.1 MAG: NADP transhydrogenase subunit alpha [Stygiobacter sp. RIFOXYC2_FULL_38_25]OGV16115.1 MAG: NADP transhydrogenase subunit alpha [Stygiobacter sp. RIFOXYA2_FULL_38_8]OGV27392.1 MAG: NADP transhydrogenase subunit alpha [Stygiobacter sp. RIFOXYC12_FULL_38_8]OGV79995.1 MAG: NADP transhydrogenase subunit alpha [Stygiobacter s